VLLVDKPAGMTSHDVVAVARRALGTRRIGHTGTLDPFATGLLVLLVGRATRLLPYVDGEPKVYDATITFGAATSTDDCTGTIVREASLPDASTIEAAMGALTGTILQRPPDFSAKQVGGVRAHAAARAGRPLALESLPVHVYNWTVRSHRPPLLDVTITCAGGTYIRSLARDLGELCHSAAHLSALRRTRSGPFAVANAVSLEMLQERSASLAPMRTAIPQLAAQRLDAAELRRVRHGNDVVAAVAGDSVALVDSSDELVAIAVRQGEALRPRVVLLDA
jgi:tRNA pseudouridine55 synthase